MQRSVAAALNPLPVILRIEIADAQHPMIRTVGRHRVNLGHEANESRVTFEDHVELAQLVTLHAVRTLGIDLVPVHVTVNPFNHGARTFQIAEPVRGMRRAQRRGILFDKGLKNAVDVCANRFAISRAIVLDVGGRIDRGKQQSAKNKGKKRPAEQA